MHAGTLVELAALAARHNHLLLAAHGETNWGADQFWVLSKSRLNRWAEEMKSLQQALHDARGLGVSGCWRRIEPVLEEILLAEVCTRVWCATLACADQLSSPGELDPVARSVYVGHLEARRRALRLLLFGRSLQTASAEPLNRLRQTCESWTDFLLAGVAPAGVARQFAFHPRRVTRLARTSQPPVDTRRASHRWSVELAALRTAVGGHAARPSASPELNAKLSAVILGCFPASCFDGCGGSRPGWYLTPFQADQSVGDVATKLCGMLNAARTAISLGQSRS